MEEALLTMRWIKKGLVFIPGEDALWMKSHAYLPTAYLVNDGVIRVYFASLDGERRGRIGYVDVDSSNPRQILEVSPKPALDLGEAGTFDDAGVSPCSVMKVQGKILLYYFGWQRLTSVPYMLFTGLAMSQDGGRTFSRYTRVPILDRTDEEPFIRSAPCVLADDGIYRMWYVAGQGWITINGTPYPTYAIKTLSSENGTGWTGRPTGCLDLRADAEFGLGRPWVMRDGDRYRMWYSIRSLDRPYHLGYAESRDGRQWVRKDGEVGIQQSAAESWDSEMLCFACIIDAAGKRYMFYNGNGHGRSGFGYAELTAD